MKLGSFWLFDLNKMCKVHFHPFALTISPCHAVGCNGVKIYITIFFFFFRGTPTPWREHASEVRINLILDTLYQR
jgi:hypothetical protein